MKKTQMLRLKIRRVLHKMWICIAASILHILEIVSANEESCQSSEYYKSYSFSIRSGYYLKGHDLQTVHSTSLLKCANLCMDDVLCRAFNFAQGTEECSMKNTRWKCYPEHLLKSENAYERLSYYEVSFCRPQKGNV